ncbi:MAG: hypothetical protein ACI9S6_003660, partial [Reinekea sp.]
MAIIVVWLKATIFSQLFLALAGTKIGISCLLQRIPECYFSEE